MPDRLRLLDRRCPVLALGDIRMIHFRAVPKQPKADTRALRNARTEIHRQLRAEIAAMAEMVPTRVLRHLLDSEHFRQHGETAQ